MKKLNVGIIGFGLSGKYFHAPIIDSVSRLKLTKIFSSNIDTVEHVKEKYSNAVVVNSVDELLNDKNIDLVVISTPNKLHFELAKKALENNKHVVVEKPFTVTSKEAEKLIDIANKNKKILTVYQNRRFDSDFLTIKDIIDNNLLGNIVEYEAHFDRFRDYFKDNWREKNVEGSGIVYDLGSHLIDQALSLFGLPIEVYADIRTQRKGGITDDNFEIILSYENLKVTLKAGMLVKARLPRFIILGDKGSFIKYGLDTQENMLRNGKSPSNNENWGVEDENLYGELDSIVNGVDMKGKIKSKNGDYRLFYKNVYKAIIGEEKLLVKPTEAKNTIRIIELAFESSKEKKVMKL